MFPIIGLVVAIIAGVAVVSEKASVSEENHVVTEEQLKR